MNDFITTCNLQKRLIRAAFWLLLQAMFMSDWKQTAQRFKLQKRLLTINKRKIIRWNIYRQQFSFTETSIKVSLKILAYVLSRLPQLVFAFFKDELEARKSLKAFFTARMITKYSLERFLSICGEEMSKGCLKLYKLIIKPDTRSLSVRSLSQILQTCINQIAA